MNSKYYTLQGRTDAAQRRTNPRHSENLCPKQSPSRTTATTTTPTEWEWWMEVGLALNPQATGSSSRPRAEG